MGVLKYPDCSHYQAYGFIILPGGTLTKKKKEGGEIQQFLLASKNEQQHAMP